MYTTLANTEFLRKNQNWLLMLQDYSKARCSATQCLKMINRQLAWKIFFLLWATSLVQPASVKLIMTVL